MSGLQIFNAHPALYLGEQSSFDRPVLSMTAEFHANGFAGITTILEQRLITTGILGVSKLHGEDVERAFPSWATVPSGQDLATARRWHFFFAWFFVLNALVYLGYSSMSCWRRRLPVALLICRNAMRSALGTPHGAQSDRRREQA